MLRNSSLHFSKLPRTAIRIGAFVMNFAQGCNFDNLDFIIWNIWKIKIPFVCINIIKNYYQRSLIDIKNNPSSVCPLTLTTASLDRKTGKFLLTIFNNLRKRQANG